MRQLTPAGQQAIDDIARRHGVSTEAALAMLDAVVRGNGSMAQFSHPEFAGSGQWMRGGMTMVSDMFNNALKTRVDSLCLALSDLVAREPGLVQTGSFQSQSQNGQEQYHGSYAAPAADTGGSGLFAPPPPDWWGPSLRWPNSTGAQNGQRYAYFAQARRLAIDTGGHVTIYDTLDHQIGGVSQQQSGSGLLAFTSQYGTVDLASLPVVSVDGQAPAPAAAPAYASMPAAAPAPAAAGSDVFATIERLAELRAKGVLDEAEFQAKKTELLGRL
ncbi:SHOCT domain-containing protein [Pseudorhodoferax sp.]|uniref:SHOCT domain-containing protein n=1 Tax=Pseudorhodoferax sp. TaxID=1993553 RepID=UPI0039E429C4